MGIIFGLAVLVLLFLGLWNRKKQDKKWVNEERYDESGAWIDKRAGERGTYGSLDLEMEKERHWISRLGKIEGMAYLIQTHCFEQYPGRFPLNDPNMKTWLAFTKTRATTFVAMIEKLVGGKIPEAPVPNVGDDENRRSLKKKILDYSYERFPKLLDIDLDVIKKFDLLAGQLSDAVIDEAERLLQK